jgi:hypothetical protein
VTNEEDRTDDHVLCTDQRKRLAPTTEEDRTDERQRLAPTTEDASTSGEASLRLY